MSEVYWASYEVAENGLPIRLGDIYLSAPKQIEVPSDNFYLLGSAIVAYPEDMSKLIHAAKAVDGQVVPHARAIADLGFDALQKGLQVSAMDLQPIYVRDKVAQTIAERNQSSQG